MIKNLEKIPTLQDSGWPEQEWLFCIRIVVFDLVQWQSAVDILAVPSYFSDKFLLVSTRVKKDFPFKCHICIISPAFSFLNSAP